MDWASVADHLVGVIDLKQDAAVHGIAGQRHRYRPVELSRFASGNTRRATDGDAIGLIAHYRKRGVRRFYVADLDALSGGAIQTKRLAQLVAPSQTPQTQVDEHWLFDIGLNENVNERDLAWLFDLERSCSGSLAWVVASESALSQSTVRQLADRIEPASLVLGIDLRQGKWIGPASPGVLASENGRCAMDDWIESGRSAGIEAALVLDVSAVGTASGPAAIEHCHRLHLRFPNWRLISGGGCRTAADAVTYLDAGCDECLVATALHH